MNNDTLRRRLDRLTSKPIVIMSHERSGTHLTIDLLRKQINQCRSWKWPGQPLSRLYVSIDSLDNPAAPTPTSSRVALAILRRFNGAALFKTHLTFRELTEGFKSYGYAIPDVWRRWLLQNARFCYVYRDGRSVMTSLYLFRDDERDAARGDWSRFLRDTDNGVTPPRRWADHVRQGLAIPDVVPIRWDNMVRDTSQFLESTADALNLDFRNRIPLLPARRRSNTLSSVWGRVAMKPESTAIVSAQAAIKWRNAFSSQDAKFFDVETQFLTAELGYEKDAMWADKIDQL